VRASLAPAVLSGIFHHISGLRAELPSAISRKKTPMKSATLDKDNQNKHDFESFRKRLLAELRTCQERVDRARKEPPMDSDPDDDAGVVSRNTYREATMGKLQRDLQTIVEIERALHRIEEGQYATCVACQSRIADARLKALPWTRTCIECAGRSNHYAGPPFTLTPRPAH